MPSNNMLLAFALASFALIIIPGPSVLFVVGRSLSHGRRVGLLSVVGNALGSVPVVLAVAFGLGAVVANSLVLFTAIKIVGACYLVFLGVQAIRSAGKKAQPSEHLTASGSTYRRTILQGATVGLTNPKTIVFFVAVLPQFVSVSAGNVAFQMILLGLIFLVIGLVSDSVWVLAAASARQWFARSPRNLIAVQRTGGAMMIGLGGVLLLAKNRP
ncbi:MAG TPA: LysE family translocator [Aeromicrobium sp.]|nr:LysE family translocator [Aeromicrobium sp.]